MISLKLYRCALGKSTSCDFRKTFVRVDAGLSV